MTFSQLSLLVCFVASAFGQFASLQGFWTGDLLSRVAFGNREGRVCLPNLAPDVVQPYKLLVEADRFQQEYDAVDVSVNIGGSTLQLERPTVLITGTILSYNEQSGLTQVQIDGADSTDCFKWKVDDNRELTEIHAFETQNNTALCDNLATVPLNARVVCDVLDNPALIRPADISTVVERATLKPTCLVTEWSTGNPCSAPCGGGVSTRTRTIINANGVGESCPALEEQDPQLCNTAPCSTDCTFTEWTEWSDCSVTCGPGEQFRTRAPTFRSVGNPICNSPGPGGQLPPTTETRVCDPAPAPCITQRDCGVSEWSAWSDCSKQCVQSLSEPSPTRTRYRTIVEPVIGDGLACPELDEVEACNTALCQRNCAGCKLNQLVGSPNWCRCCANANACSPDDKTNFQLSGCLQAGFCSRFCLEGSQCAGISVDSNPPIALPCVVAAWSEWGACVGGTCDADRAVLSMGERRAYRTVKRSPSAGGDACPELTRTEACEPACASEGLTAAADPCRAGQWSEWDAFCPCGGERSRTRTVAPTSADAVCETVEKEACPSAQCYRDCVYTAWGPWTRCTKDCAGKGGAGIQTRTRSTQMEAINGGKPCQSSELSETRVCNTNKCGQDCDVSAPVAQGECSLACGTGVQSFVREVVRAPWGDDARACPEPLVYDGPCFVRACQPGECGIGEWSAWSECSAFCDGGERQRTRSVPSICPEDQASEESQPCNTFACAAVLDSFAVVGLMGGSSTSLDAAQLDSLATAARVPAVRLADDSNSESGVQVRVYDAEGEPAQMFVDRMISAVNGVGVAGFTEAEQRVRSTYNEVVIRTDAPTPAPTEPTTAAPTGAFTTASASNNNNNNNSNDSGANTTNDGAPSSTQGVVAPGEDSGLPVYVPIIIVVGVLVLICFIVGVVLSVLSARKGRQEAQKRGVMGTVTRTEQLSGGPMVGQQLDDSSSEPDEGSEVREFRRQQQQRRRRSALKESKSSGRSQPSRDGSARKEESNANDDTPAATSGAATPQPTANNDDASGSGSYSYSYSYSYDESN